MIKQLPKYVLRISLKRETSMPDFVKALYCNQFLVDIHVLYILKTPEKQSFLLFSRGMKD